MARAEDLALTSFTGQQERGSNYKQLFGSDVAFRDDGVLPLQISDGVGARPSYAAGGLSNVWGSGLLPYTEHDLGGWPVSAPELAGGYRAALELLPFAAEDDELARRYPLYRDPDGPLARTRAGEELLARLSRHSASLGAAGYVFGAPRLAVRVGHPAPGRDASTAATASTAALTVTSTAGLRRSPRCSDRGAVEYRPGLHVDRLRETGDGVTVEATELAGITTVRLHFERVFLAAGAISSTVILQRSGLLPARCEIRDSQALYVPFAWAGRVGRTGREPGHTLAQVTMVLEDPGGLVEPRSPDLLLLQQRRGRAGPRGPPRISRMLGPALEVLTRRLLVAICFFHSDDSDSLLSCGPGSETGRLEAVRRGDRKATARRFSQALRRSLAPLGVVPLMPFAEHAPVGGGYHYGGSAPMHHDAGPGQADTLGRPAGAGRVHVVDSSCFPSVPGGAITLTAMANAHRIATAAASGLAV